jgi:hypothetical protein
VIDTATRTIAAKPALVLPGAHDRAFYSGIAIVLVLTVFIRFSRTYYLPTYFGGPATALGAPELTWDEGLIGLSIPARVAISGATAWRTFAKWLVR